MFGVGSGNAIEWYDWGIYAVFAPFFASQFFHSASPVSNLLHSLVVFAVGFLGRPFGGLLFGWLADKAGRKASMTWTVALSAGASLVIGLCPSYEAIGIAAGVILVLARLTQGLAHGGELPAAQTYIAETAPKERRGLWSSLIYFSGTIGQLIALVLAAGISSLLSAAAMHSYGWRIAFVLGGVFGLYSLYMRTRLEESELFEEESKAVGQKSDRLGIWTDVRRQPRLLLQICGLVIGTTVLYYAWAISAPAYAIAVVGMPASQALWAGAAAQVVFLIMLPLGGILSDRIGRKPMMFVSMGSLMALTFPLNAMLNPSPWSLFVVMSIALIPLGALAPVATAVYAEIFPTRIRTLGLALPYALCVAIFGGTAPYLQTFFGNRGTPSTFLWYAIGLGVIFLGTVLTLPETKGINLSTGTPDPAGPDQAIANSPASPARPPTPKGS